MGYLSILAAIPGFFLSSLIFMALWGVIAPDFGMEKMGYANNYHTLACCGSFGGSGWSKRRKAV